MKKAATQAFELYKLMMHSTEEGVRALSGKEAKKLKRQDMIRDISRCEPDFLNSLNYVIMAEELAWVKKSQRVIMPENLAFFERLLNAKYTMKSAKGFTLPYMTFILAMPEGLVHNGITIPPCLVDYGPFEKAEERIIHPFADYLDMGRPAVKHQECSPGAYGLSITYREAGTLAYARAMAVDDDLPKIISSSCADEYRENIGEYGVFERLTQMNDTDYEIQYLLLKLVTSIGIYNLATGGSHLHEGFPGKKMPELIGRDPAQMIRMSYLSAAETSELKPAEVEVVQPEHLSHEPAWYFNQDTGSAYDEADRGGHDHPFGIFFSHAKR